MIALFIPNPAIRVTKMTPGEDAAGPVAGRIPSLASVSVPAA
jgi:hypothetical protein